MTISFTFNGNCFGETMSDTWVVHVPCLMNTRALPTGAELLREIVDQPQENSKLRVWMDDVDKPQEKKPRVCI